MAPLLSLIQQQEIKTISPNWAKKVKEATGKSNYDQLAEEVEETKLAPLMGIALFQDVQDNPTTTENALILGGGTFADCRGNTVKFKGARYILAYMNYSQIVAESYVADTYTGFVKKDRSESEGLSSSERKELKINAQDIAMAQWDLLKQFLNENSDDYPLWSCTISRRPYRPKLTGVKRTIN